MELHGSGEQDRASSIHIDALWGTFRDRKQYLLQLKHGLKVDVFLGYRSNCDNAGVEVPYQSLEMFVELQVPFGLSNHRHVERVQLRPHSQCL